VISAWGMWLFYCKIINDSQLRSTSLVPGLDKFHARIGIVVGSWYHLRSGDILALWAIIGVLSI
jgi:hypothetical protein